MTRIFALLACAWLLPAVAWEAVFLGAGALGRSRLSPARQTLVLTGLVGLSVVLAPPRPEGEMASLQEARDRAALVTLLAADVRTWPEGS